MSRIGKKPISIPSGVKLEQKSGQVKISGPLGSIEVTCRPQIEVRLDSATGNIVVDNKNPQVREDKQLHGTMRALLANMVEGVSKGFEKKLEIYGTGYTVKELSGKLVLQVGFANPMEIAIPQGVKVKIDVGATRGDDTPAKFSMSSVDKCVLGRFAADVRKIRPPEPYKGKGIRRAGEVVKRKVGKTFTSGTA
ncbi:MAG TPA: 50S ribosomal protein L6 [Sedimentisphaerales bacterium]|jgi:ribosomal protein L6, bacterial type